MCNFHYFAIKSTRSDHFLELNYFSSCSEYNNEVLDMELWCLSRKVHPIRLLCVFYTKERPTLLMITTLVFPPFNEFSASSGFFNGHRKWKVHFKLTAPQLVLGFIILLLPTWRTTTGTSFDEWFVGRSNKPNSLSSFSFSHKMRIHNLPTKTGTN